VEQKEICINCNTKNVIKTELSKDLGDNIYSYLCLKCGFTTNSNFKTGELIKSMNNVSQLILDLSLYDEDRGLHWFPIVLISTRGSIYPEGIKEDWKWVYTPIIEINESEKNNYGDEYTQRFAVDLSEKFDKYRFIDACKKMGNVSQDLEIE